jgi:hypothetical protein
MNDDSFEIRAENVNTISKMIAALLPLAMIAWSVYNLITDDSGAIMFVFRILIMAAAAMWAAAWVADISEKITVQGDHIHYRNMFRQRAFSFDDIARVEFRVTRTARHGELHDFYVYLHGQTRQAVAIPKNHVNSDRLAARLKDRNIPGAETL